MTTKLPLELAWILALGIGVLLSASQANAIPQCVNTAPNTTQCQTNGSSQITTQPGPWTYNYGWPGWGWGFGWPVFGFGFG
ncbi:hypothetical protein KXD97_21510 [Mycobacterium sp. SMC-8]|uniref:hypothetical protein n=1 Tax=Mycobacterium sp. SMC-8 TaxID=2857060 RepID=UPI0021B27B9E|nr:hypothetical protein [Mycobacterium sp. SMC-8]UXA10664.1 hypothetical protein KXD97_21510 [Mycobacterium sp. SMC-8]